VLPGDAGPEWTDRLATEDSRLRSARSGVPAVAALLAVAIALVAVQVQDATVWLCVAVLVLAGALGAVSSARRLSTVERLAADLESRARV
jgi:Flp pilus assembly protein TadB